MLVTEQDYLEHYGRLGMKWYQHKYGDADSRTKYAEKNHKKSSAEKHTEDKSKEAEVSTKSIAKGKARVTKMLSEKQLGKLTDTLPPDAKKKFDNEYSRWLQTYKVGRASGKNVLRSLNNANYEYEVNRLDRRYRYR